MKDNTDLQKSTPPPPIDVAAEPVEVEKPEINPDKPRSAGDHVKPVESGKPEVVSQRAHSDVELGNMPDHKLPEHKLPENKLPDHKPSLSDTTVPVIRESRPARNTRPPDRLKYDKLGGG